MFNKFGLALFVTVALAAFTAALPHFQPHRRNITPLPTVSLGKRNTLTRDDGVIDMEKAVHSVLKTKNKHKQNLLNLQRNSALGLNLPGNVRDTFRFVPSSSPTWLSDDRHRRPRSTFGRTLQDWFRTADGPATRDRLDRTNNDW